MQVYASASQNYFTVITPLFNTSQLQVTVIMKAIFFIGLLKQAQCDTFNLLTVRTFTHQLASMF